MKKTTLIAVALASILAVGAFAHGGDNDEGTEQHGMMSGGMMGGQNESMMGGENQQKAWSKNTKNRGTMNGYKKRRDMDDNDMANNEAMNGGGQ